MYYLQYERFISVLYRQEVVCPIEHRREYCKVVVTCDTNGCKRSYSSKIPEIGILHMTMTI